MCGRYEGIDERVIARCVDEEWSLGDFVMSGGELAAMGVNEIGHNAQRMFNVEGPSLDWVALAQGHGVQAVRVTDMDGFNAAFAEAMAQRGPRLIEVLC